MTTPNDAPRPTSDLVKRLKCDAAMVREWGSVEDVRVSADLTEAAASLQSLEARNKELADLCVEANRAIQTLVDMAKCGIPDTDVMQDAAIRVGAHMTARVIAALHPATKTGET